MMKDETPHISADVLDSISAYTAWILLWVRRPDLRPSVEVLKTFAGRVESWKRVLEIAHQNDLGQLLASNLRGMASDEIGMPTWVAQELDQRHSMGTDFPLNKPFFCEEFTRRSILSCTLITSYDFIACTASRAAS